MASLYAQKNSPYYWLRYYDPTEADPAKRRKSINTKIKLTAADKRKIEEAKKASVNGKRQKIKLTGNPKVNKLKREFEAGLSELIIQKKSGVKLIKKLKLSEGYAEYKAVRSVPGSKKYLKPKTFQNYDLAVKHFIDVCKDKYIYKYHESDYVKLLYYFEERKLSKNSKSIYTRALHTLWNYFVDKHYTRQNIIEVVESEEKDPEPIPLEDMYSIINYLKQDTAHPHHYQIIYFMLLTGCRPSSAIVQLKENIDFRRKIITIQNVKTGARKGKPYYRFPLYKELENLLKEMGVKQGDKGRLFDMFAVVPDNYTWPLSFWDRRIKLLLSAKSIEKRYTLKQIRPTTASFLINVLQMDIFSVKKLLDHANIKITDKNYVDFNVNNARKELDEITLESFLEEEI